MDIFEPEMNACLSRTEFERQKILRMFIPFMNVEPFVEIFS